MFKVGDRVRVIGSYYTNFPTGSPYNLPRGVGIVRASGTGYLYIDYDGKTSPAVFPSCVELVDPKDEAIELLKAAGYTITPPPEPLKGKVYIYKNAQGDVHAMSRNNGQMYRSVAGECNLIAIVDWTEGDGL